MTEGPRTKLTASLEPADHLASNEQVHDGVEIDGQRVQANEGLGNCSRRVGSAEARGIDPWGKRRVTQSKTRHTSASQIDSYRNVG